MQTALRSIIRRAIEQPTETAIIDDQRRWRYADLVGGATHLAERLESATSKQNIGIMLPTGGAFPMAMLAIWLLGRTAVPINYLLNERERQYIIDDSEIDTLISAGAMLDFLGAKPEGIKIIELDKIAFEGPPPLRWAVRRSLDDIAVILYTSGTSGKPKGVMLSHGNLSSNVWNAVAHVGFTHADTFLGVLPQFHSFGMTGLTLAPLCLGAKVIYTARFIPRKVIGLIRKHRPQIIMAIPSMYNALLTVKDSKPEDFKSIWLPASGGEPLPRAVEERFYSRFGIHILEGYGLTETSPIVSLNVPGRAAERSVGKLIPGCHVRIVDEADHSLTADQEGEILLSGPNVMKGYYKLPQQTLEVLRPDGYFRTGDWGKLDSSGFLYITGRKKDMLIISGENVFPREIEEILNMHPSVKDSAVIGKQDDTRGELPIAFVELQEDTEFDEAAIRSHCREHLPGFKVPREIRHIDQLPRNPTGKILRRELKT